MFKRIQWRNIAEMVGVLAIVASLVFVGLQLQQTQTIAQSEVMSTNVGHRIGANTAIAEHSELWVKASSGEVLSAAEEVVIDRLLDSVSVERVALWMQLRELGLESSAEVILTDFAGFLHKNPGIYQRWLARERGFVADRRAVLGPEDSLQAWVESMRARVEKIASANQQD